MMTVAFDLDGVLVDFVSGMLPLLGIHTYQPPRRWNWSDLDVTATQLASAWQRIRETPDWFLDLPRLSGAEQLLAALLRGEFASRRLLFVTSRPQCAGRAVGVQSRMWLEKWLGLDKPEVVVCRNPQQKLQTIRVYDVDFMLDDFGPFVEIARHDRPGVRLLRQPWNQAEELAYGMPGVWSVNEFLRQIERAEA